MPAEWADLEPGEAAGRVRIGIETDRGPWVQALIAAGYQVYAINPMSVARYRERHSTSGAKSDAGDAHVLAEIVRLDHAHHRPVAGDSAQAEAMKLVARTHQTLIWDRSRQLLRLLSALREFFPAALDAFDDLTASDALELLSRAPDPARAARLSRSQIAAVLRRANRRNVDVKAGDMQQRLRAAQLRQPDAVQSAYAAIVTTQVRLIAALNAEVEQLGQVVADHFGRHRDAEHYLSQPGLGVVLGARILGEFGDDPHRFTDAKARKNYAGTSPITRASGTRKVVLARYARNRRLGDAIHQWAFCALKRLTRSPRLLRQPACPRHRSPSRLAPTRQPPRRHPARLSQDRHRIRRDNRLVTSPAHFLTPKNMGCLPQTARPVSVRSCR